MTIALDLGCGANPRNPFDAETVYGIDLDGHPETSVIKADLTIEPIPFTNGYFDYVTAYDFIEHVPRIIYIAEERGEQPRRWYPFVELMNEIWRVLRPGGKFLSYTPCYPHGPAFRDPTHCNICTEETFFYFDNLEGGCHGMAKMYGFKGGFHIESQTWNAPWLISILVKPA